MGVADRVYGGLSSASRTKILGGDRIPAINRWAIFVRPLRGLLKSFFLKIKIPSPPATRNGRERRDLLKIGIPLRPEHHSRAFKTATAFGQVSWLGITSDWRCFTVARPRGIHTRFPILPALMRGT